MFFQIMKLSLETIIKKKNNVIVYQIESQIYTIIF